MPTRTFTAQSRATSRIPFVESSSPSELKGAWLDTEEAYVYLLKHCTARFVSILSLIQQFPLICQFSSFELLWLLIWLIWTIVIDVFEHLKILVEIKAFAQGPAARDAGIWTQGCASPASSSFPWEVAWRSQTGGSYLCTRGAPYPKFKKKKKS